MADENVRTADRPLSNLNFVITGSFPRMTREQFTDLLENQGGRVTGSVSKKTDYLIIGENPGSKADKAEALGVKILSMDEFRALFPAALLNPEPK